MSAPNLTANGLKLGDIVKFENNLQKTVEGKIICIAKYSNFISYTIERNNIIYVREVNIGD